MEKDCFVKTFIEAHNEADSLFSKLCMLKNIGKNFLSDNDQKELDNAIRYLDVSRMFLIRTELIYTENAPFKHLLNEI